MSIDTYDPTPVLRTDRGRRTATRILDVAEEIFAERGFAGTRLSDIAAKAGLRAPSLYNHWANKEELYGAVLERAIAPLLEMFGRFADGPPEQLSVDVMIEEAMAWLAARPDIARIVHREALDGGARLAAWMEPILSVAGRTMRRAQDDELLLRFVAINNIFLGYFSMAPLYETALGVDLSSDAAVAAQTRFLKKFLDNAGDR